jgi:hypothetical protein
LTVDPDRRTVSGRRRLSMAVRSASLERETGLEPATFSLEGRDI